MDLTVFLAVLAAAALHAGWNAVVKVGLDRLTSVALINFFGGFVSLFALPFLPFPNAAAWPWLLTSVVLHCGYKLFLVRAYESGDMGQVYPLARGAGPLLVFIFSVAFGLDTLSPYNFTGTLVLIAGVFLMAWRGGSEPKAVSLTTIAFALGTSVFIASYTLVDGFGGRAAQNAFTFAAWLFVLDALVLTVIYFWRRGTNGFVLMARNWKPGVAGGMMSMMAYGIAIWAMTKAPIAAVAALRETSVLFAVLIATFFLKEKLTFWRCIASVVIVSGVIVLRLGAY